MPRKQAKQAKQNKQAKQVKLNEQRGGRHKLIGFSLYAHDMQPALMRALPSVLRDMQDRRVQIQRLNYGCGGRLHLKEIHGWDGRRGV